MNDHEFYQELLTSAIEVPDESTGQFTSGIYSRTFTLGDQQYTVMLDMYDDYYIEINKDSTLEDKQKFNTALKLYVAENREALQEIFK